MSAQNSQRISNLHLTDLPTLADWLAKQHGLVLVIHPKSVKNINFRITSHSLSVSHPHHLPAYALLEAIIAKLPRVLQAQARLAQRMHTTPAHTNPLGYPHPMLWGRALDSWDESQLAMQGFGDLRRAISLGNAPNPEMMVAIYRQAMTWALPKLIQTWQAKTGKSAQQIRLKKMHSRWGSCNAHAGRVWLSVYLAAFPYRCAEYVLVHELCHLSHANHSKAFWALVAQVMPDYQHWHDMLAGRIAIDWQAHDIDG